MRPGSNRRLVLLSGLAWIVILPGCTGYRPTQSGYLSDYSQLKRDPIHLNYGLGLQRANSRNAPGDVSCPIESYYIEPVVWIVDDSGRNGGKSKHREVLTSSLDQALRDQLGKLRPIVDQPGPKTARVRAAITDVKLSKPWLNLLLTATVFSPWKIGPIFNGGGFVEAEVLGPDGQQIAAVTVASGGGMLDLIGYYTRSRHARQAMKRAAWELRETLDPQ